MCWAQLAGNAGPKKLPKIRHLGTIAQFCWAISSQLRHVWTVRKKNLLNSNISSTCPHSMVNFSPLRVEIVSFSLWHPSKFQRVLRFGFVTAVTLLNGSQPNCTMFGRLRGWYTIYIHFWRFLPCNGILPCATFTLCPRLALSYFGSVTARHCSSGRQPNFAELNRGRHLYSAGRPWHWALAHILVVNVMQLVRCACVCPVNSFQSKWPLMWIFVMSVHLDPV